MGFLGVLKFLLTCSDFLAWPVLALGYPLWASIRAIETGSKYHMRKLVVYWTLFSLLSLFELGFVKIIEWIPHWSYMKLIVICGLVLPRFNGACYVYECLLQPCLSSNDLNLQAVMSRLYLAKEDKPVKTEIFLDVAEKYIKEHGSDALETLIAPKPDKGHDTTLEDKVMLQPTEQTATKPNLSKLANHAQPNLGTSAEKKLDVTAVVKEMAPPNAEAAESNCPETLAVRNIQREWTCALCLVTTTSEKTLHAHFQGMKHKTKCALQKISKNAPKVTGSSLPLTKNKATKAKAETVKKPAGDGLLPKPLNKAEKPVKAQLETSHQKRPMPEHGQTSKLVCCVCDLKLRNEHDLRSHIKGKKHLSNLEKIITGTSRLPIS